ncbi:hypothetical protein HYR99_13050 [Candidatus Poribacteria bacterium]|nr:hypothetical protein [Candidatus Poribacteria bacterium]
MHSLPIDQNKLKTFVKQCKHFNIFPIHVPRYFPDKQHPINSLMAELIDECVQYLSIMTEQEVKSLLDSLPIGVRMFIDYDPTLGRNVFLERIALYYLVYELQQKYFSFKQIVEENLGESEVLKIYPELRKKLDKDGLLHIDEELKLLDGGIEYRDHVLHYHQFLRRGYTSNPNFDFIYRFIAHYHRTRSENRFRIAIDHRRIMPKEFYQHIAEFDTWFGPRYDPEKLDDPYATGLTIIKRNKHSLFELTNRLDRTEFFWSFRDGIKTLQIEEISDVGYQFDHYYLNRYIHSERDTQEQVLRHLDGAVKVYLREGYEDRLHSSKYEKCYSKTKLFRVDGNIAIDDWIQLISCFYKSNEMIIEYFNPEQFQQMFEECVRDFEAWKLKQQQSSNESE